MNHFQFPVQDRERVYLGSLGSSYTVVLQEPGNRKYVPSVSIARELESTVCHGRTETI